MSKNIFFERQGPFDVKDLFKNYEILKNSEINDVKTLSQSTINDISFFESIKYKEEAINTKASYCITSEKLKKFLPNNCTSIIVKSVLFELARITKIFQYWEFIVVPTMAVSCSLFPLHSCATRRL